MQLLVSTTDDATCEKLRELAKSEVVFMKSEELYNRSIRSAFYLILEQNKSRSLCGLLRLCKDNSLVKIIINGLAIHI